MKILKNILLTMFCVMVAVSCSTVEKFTVYGNPGDKIYSPDKLPIATIQQNGEVKITLESDAYYGYLFTYNSEHNQWVPFALDLNKKSHNGTKLAAGAGYTLTGLGLVGVVAGTIACIADDEDGAAKALLLGSLGVSGIGASIGAPASSRMRQLSYQYNFGYKSKQMVNSDLNLSPYIPPTFNTPEPIRNRKKATSGDASVDTDSNSTKTNKNSMTSQAKKKRKSIAELIAGNYSGTGTLMSTGEDSETLDTMLIILTPKDDNTVVAEIMEDNEDFFESEELFKVIKNKDGSYTLKHTQIPSVKFTISKTGKVVYQHSKVNIDGVIYTLSISASKNVK